MSLTFDIVAFTVEAEMGNFNFSHHYIIILLAVSLFYASVMHPLECYQVGICDVVVWYFLNCFTHFFPTLEY